jgi:regulator of sigma E protease
LAVSALWGWWSFGQGPQQLTSVITWIDAQGALGVIVYVLLYVLAALCFIPGSALTLAAGQVGTVITSSLSGLWHMVTGAISTCNLSGPIGIAESSGDMASQGWGQFLWFIAVLSTAIGLFNLFPIPVLDGGHLVFHAWEAVTRRPPPERALRALMLAGLTVLLSLMLFAIWNDITCP